jgi:hypothetical protein
MSNGSRPLCDFTIQEAERVFLEIAPDYFHDLFVLSDAQDLLGRAWAAVDLIEVQDVPIVRSPLHVQRRRASKAQRPRPASWEWQRGRDPFDIGDGVV